MMAAEFNFDSDCTTPYLSALSSPRGFGNYLCYYTSAPTSPSGVAAVYNHFGAGEPWEENQIKDVNGGIGGSDDNEESQDFEFEIGRNSVVGEDEDHPTATADELFEDGKIRPLDPTRGRNHNRDRDRGCRKTTARSLSPLREEELNSRTTTTTVVKSTTTKKWTFKDFFLFRSASEGRATGNRKDPLWKHTAALMTKANAKNSSFRSTDTGGSRSMRRELSPHERRRKTFLPYRQELLGCLGFSPSIDSIAKAFGSITGGSSRGSRRSYENFAMQHPFFH